MHPVDDYPAQLLAALRGRGAGGRHATRASWCSRPGVYNAAYFEHALLARLWASSWSRGATWPARGNRVRMRTTQGERPVHVVYRRIDDEFLDPLHFRPDSVLGCPGIVNAARAGNVTLANAIGNGVADDKLLYTYVPDLIRYYLHEEPIIANVETHRLDDPEPCTDVLDRLDELVLKPVDGAGGKGIVIGPQRRRGDAGRRSATAVAADPRGWIAQRPVALSTSPTLIGDRVAPRHVDLRPFAVNDGDDVWLLPGGLTRVALPEGALVVNSSQGGGSKDTWVLADATPPTASPSSQAAPTHADPRRRRPGRSRVTGPRATPAPDPSRRVSSSERGHAQPHRRVAVLDRPVRRAGRRHRPHPRRVPRTGCSRTPGSTRTRPAASLLADPRRRGAPSGAVGHRRRCSTCSAFDPDNPSSIAGALARGPRERPRRAGDHLQRDVGVPQRHLARAARASAARRRAPRAARCSWASCASGRPCWPGWPSRR